MLVILKYISIKQEKEKLFQIRKSKSIIIENKCTENILLKKKMTDVRYKKVVVI